MYSAHPLTVPSAGISVAAVATGGSHTCVVASGGGLWCWGVNGDGQLGINSTTDQSMPAAVSLGAGGQGTKLLAAPPMLPQHLYYSCAFDAAVFHAVNSPVDTNPHTYTLVRACARAGAAGLSNLLAAIAHWLGLLRRLVRAKLLYARALIRVQSSCQCVEGS
jgi:hypothetical protein